MKRLQALRDLVTLHLETASHRQERYYNRRHREVVYEIGDLVMRRQHVSSSAANIVSSKLAPKYKGPHTIIRVLSKVVYEVTDSEDRVDKVHVEDVKRQCPYPRVFLPGLRPAGCECAAVSEMRVGEGPRSPWAERPADSGANASARSGGTGGRCPREDTHRIIHWSRLLPRQSTNGPGRRRRHGHLLEPLPGGSILVLCRME